jgi:hypothetical protein
MLVSISCIRAALAAQHGAVALTGPSTAALHGFALYEEDLSVVHLVRLDRGCSHHAAKINHHRLSHAIKELQERFAYFPGSRRGRLAIAGLAARVCTVSLRSA